MAIIVDHARFAKIHSLICKGKKVFFCKGVSRPKSMGLEQLFPNNVLKVENNMQGFSSLSRFYLSLAKFN